MSGYRINNKRNQCPFNIAKVESEYNAKYVGEFCLRTVNGSWANAAVSVFYVAKPARKEYSNYFGIFQRDGNTFITNAISAAQEPFVGLVAKDGEVIYSAYRHDFTRSKDESVYIDGGREYVRRGGAGEVVLLSIVEDRIEVISKEMSEITKYLET